MRGRVRGGGPRTRRAFLRDLARLGGSLAGLGLLAGCAPTPAPADSRPARVYRVGLLAQINNSESEAFWGRLAELGYVEGQNLAKEERLVDDLDEFLTQFDDLAAELAHLPVDVIVTVSDRARDATARATTSIPIVTMGSILSPVEAGLAQSLARPGGNVTGLLSAPPELDLKRLQLLVEAAPAISKGAVLLGQPRLSSEAWEYAAGSLGVSYVGLTVRAREDFAPTLEHAIAEGAGGLLVQAGTSHVLNADLIVGLAERYRLPAIYWNRGWVSRGGLMTYEGRTSERQRRAAEFVDRILRGARPGDLPIEYQMRYDLVLNMRTARALGLTFSRDFLAQVDEVIE